VAGNASTTQQVYAFTLLERRSATCERTAHDGVALSDFLFQLAHLDSSEPIVFSGRGEGREG
jgi:hypothetical protein